MKTPTKTLLTTVALGTLAFGTVAPAAEAITDPFPNAPVCTVDSDHVTIQKGSNGNSVREAQCLLNKTGARLTVDGAFGSATDTAVRNFQRSHGLSVDGVVGHDTWSKLISVGGTTTPAPSTGSRDQKVQKVIAWGKSQMGKPYVWGAEGPNSYDCSGLTMRAYQQVGINLPRYSENQASSTRQVSAKDALPGDLMHWPGHVGIYLGNGKVLEASSSRHQVIITNSWGSPTYHRVIQ